MLSFIVLPCFPGQRKYGHKSNSLYKAIVKLFTCLPVAAVVNSKTLILHGGLFRCPEKRERKKKDNEDILSCGNLKDLARAGSGGVDPFDGAVRTHRLFVIVGTRDQVRGDLLSRMSYRLTSSGATQCRIPV